MARKMPSSRTLSLLLLLALALGISLPGYLRFDLTDEKLYSLSPGTQTIIQSLKQKVSIKLYVSRSIAGLPPILHAHGRRVEEFLREYAAHTKGALQVELIDPLPDSDDEVWARKYGVRALPAPGGESVYLGAVFIDGDREIAIPFFDPRKEDVLEFEVSEALAKLQKKPDNRIGIYSSLPIGVNGSQPTDNSGQRLDWIFLGRLKDFYQVEVFPTPPEVIPSDMKVFILMHPKEVDERLEYALDQFVMRGGRLVLILDPFSRYDLDRQVAQDQTQAFEVSPSSSDLPRLLNHWGIRFTAKDMVADLQHSTKVERSAQVFDNPLYLSLDKRHFSGSAVATASLTQLLMVEAGSFDTSSLKPGLNYEALIQSSATAGLVPHVFNSLSEPGAIASKIGSERKVQQLTGFLKGQFTSAFSKPPEGASQAGEHLAKTSGDNIVLLIGDSDFLHESHAIEGLKIGEQWVQKPRNDNIQLLTNALNFLSGSNELISLRSSGRVQRPFTRLKKMQEKAVERWQAEEEALNVSISTSAKNLGFLQAQTKEDGASSPASEALKQQIQTIREEELKLRAERREIRRKLREDIEALGFQLKALNLLLLPSLVSVGGILLNVA